MTRPFLGRHPPFVHRGFWGPRGKQRGRAHGPSSPRGVSQSYHSPPLVPVLTGGGPGRWDLVRPPRKRWPPRAGDRCLLHQSARPPPSCPEAASARALGRGVTGHASAAQGTAPETWRPVCFCASEGAAQRGQPGASLMVCPASWLLSQPTLPAVSLTQAVARTVPARPWGEARQGPGGLPSAPPNPGPGPCFCGEAALLLNT